MRAVVSLSGGMDSATVLAEALDQGREVIPVSFAYGSKHGHWERVAAGYLCDHYDLSSPLLKVDLTGVMENFKSDLLSSGGEIPEGHYEAETMRRTVVPGRNLIFASVLTGIAWSVDAPEIWLGIHAGDHYIYPDCRPEFFYAMKEAVELGTEQKVSLRAPFLHINKVGIIQRGLQLNVPYNLTRTCYKNQRVACGKCGSCQERLSAFAANKIEDPITYESRVLIPK